MFDGDELSFKDTKMVMTAVSCLGTILSIFY